MATLDPIIFGKVEQNRFILGMAEFSIGAVFNTLAFCAILCTGLAKQSTGLYLLFLMAADSLALVTGVLMDEFYNPLIDVDVFGDSDDPKKLCQAIYFLREMFYYWRWFLLAMLLIDRVLLVSGTAGMRRLRIVAVIMSLVLLGVSGGLAGYWIDWVDNTLFALTQGFYVPGMCRITPVTAGDTSSTWFYMDTIVHLILPDLVMVIVVFVTGMVLLSRLNGKAAQTQEPDDFNMSKTLVTLSYINVIIMLPYIIVNGFILNVDKAYDTYDFSTTVDNNLKYTSRITGKFAGFVMCITFFVLLFGRQFRSFCCKN